MSRTMWTQPVACVLVVALAQPAIAAEPAPSEPRYATVEIDTSDIPEQHDWTGATRGRFARRRRK